MVRFYNLPTGIYYPLFSAEGVRIPYQAAQARHRRRLGTGTTPRSWRETNAEAGTH